MIEEVKTLLADRGLRRAVLIDDAFDDRPRVGDIEDDTWNRFFTDISDDDEKLMSAAYGVDDYNSHDASELRREQYFIDVVWEHREKISCATELFGDFEQNQRTKREQLAPLQKVLQTDLELTYETFGRDEAAPIADADIIFLDLFLGFIEQDEAVIRAIERVKNIVAQRRDRPPIVVLLSGNARLDELAPRVRDDAELLGCQFRTMHKTDLTDPDNITESLYELAGVYPDAQRVNRFLRAWEDALQSARAKFLRNVRTLDLADYANLHSLVLKAENEPVGDYVLDMYDLHLHQVLEENEGLVRTAKALNEIDWKEYPPAQFMPSDQVVALMDGATFENELRTRVEAEVDNDPLRVRLGDVFLAPLPPAVTGDTADAQGEAAPARARHAYVVLSPECDIQHGNLESLLVLRGVVRTYSAKHQDTSRERTPVIFVAGTKFSIEWEPKISETWTPDDLTRKLAAGYRRVRRFRTPFALQLQQAFIGQLGRVGTMAALPGRHATAIRVLLRSRDGSPRLLAERPVTSPDAVCLVGRSDKNKPIEWLLLSKSLQDEVRKNLRALDANLLPTGGVAQLATIRNDPQFYKRLKGALVVNRAAASAGSKPFSGTPHDVLQIVTSRLPDGPLGTNLKEIVIELETE